MRVLAKCWGVPLCYFLLANGEFFDRGLFCIYMRAVNNVGEI